MRKHSIGTRCMAWLLLAVMLVSFVPALELSAYALTTYDLYFQDAASEGITMLNNGKNASLSIKVNNFVNDGLLFEYLSTGKEYETPDASYYLWEYSKNVDGQAYVQLYPFKLRADKGDAVTVNGTDTDGFSDKIKVDGSLDLGANAGDDTGVSSSGATVDRSLKPTLRTDNKGQTVSEKTEDGAWNVDGETAFLRMKPTGTQADGDTNDRAWTKLTTFTSNVNVRDVRYAVIVYRSVTNSYSYEDFGLTVNTFDATGSNSSQFVKIGPSSSNWQFAVIDLLGGDINSSTRVSSVYLQSPLKYTKDNLAMDIAAVGYFPYYGDAEQFGYYGVSMGCDPEYLKSTVHNSAFSFRIDSKQPDGSVYDSIHNNVSKYGVVSTNGATFNADNTIDQIGYALFGEVSGGAALGLLEPSLDANGRPVYKQTTVEYVAALLQYHLTTIPEYPAGNSGWRNYAFVTGSSTSGGSNEALFGTDDQGRSVDLGTAICKQLGVTKGSGTTGGTLGDYHTTKGNAAKLTGTWNQCKGNLTTWMDVAYYLLHNLFVTDHEVADSEVDGYGEYEDDYQKMVLPQVQLTQDGVTTNAYFFDSGYAYNHYTEGAGTTVKDMTGEEFTSAIIFDKNQHTITMNGDAEGKALYATNASGTKFTNIFPFLPTSGTGSHSGETNTPYFTCSSGTRRETVGITYQAHDFNYAMSGSGYFYYKENDNLYFNFEGDDDVYLFVNGQLVVDVGGSHGATKYNMNLNDYVTWARELKNNTTEYNKLTEAEKARVDALCLEEGGRYTFNFFYLERHGVGANLRILTNITVGESGLDVDKTAYQNGHEVMDNGMVDANEYIEYSFAIANNSDSKLYNLSFEDPTIGVKLSAANGLEIEDGKDVKNAYGSVLMPNNLKISVGGTDGNGDEVAITVTIANNEELKNFLKSMQSNDGTQSGTYDETTGKYSDYQNLHSGSGLWLDATITIRGIYYKMSEAERSTGRFTNTLSATGVGEGGPITGMARHTVYQTGSTVTYYQWVNNPIVVTRDRLYQDLIEKKVVENEANLPLPGDAILIPSDASGTEVGNGTVSNTPGGNVYLQIDYKSAGAHMSYVTIRDRTDPTFSITVPIAVYAVDDQNSLFVLDYGLDTFLTENDAIFKGELNAALGAMGTIMGITDDGTDLGYDKYDSAGAMQNTVVGNVDNELEKIAGTVNSSGKHSQAYYAMSTPVHLEYDKPWIVEWKGIMAAGGDMLFSLDSASGAEDNVFLYIRNTSDNPKKYIGIGYNAKTKLNNSENLEGIRKFTYCVTAEDPSNASDPITAALTSKTANIYQLRNVPDAHGANVIQLYIGATADTLTYMGDLSTLFINDTNWSEKTAWEDNLDKNWIVGRDFTFNYIGCEGSSGLDSTYEYIHVYPDGEQLTNYNWKMESGALKATDSNKSGYVSNAATLTSGTINADGTLVVDSDGNAAAWKLDQPVFLSHDLPWEISYQAKITKPTQVLSENSDFEVGSLALYMYPSTDLLGVAVRGQDTESYYTMYATKIEDYIKGFDMTAGENTYTLKNQVNPDGTNMIYLYVNGTYAGPLESNYRKGSSTPVLVAEKTNALNGMDLEFGYIGHKNANHGFRENSTLSAMSICLNTGLSSVYEWKLASTKINGLVNVNGTVDNGNQIVFSNATDVNNDGQIEIERNEGKFTLSGTDLKFETDGFMDKKYTAYVALTIHDKDFTPTQLDSDAINIGKEVQLYKQITVLPANVVYYEDDFPAIKYPGTDNTFTLIGSSDDLTQSADQNTPHGSDPTYAGNSSDNSGGSLHTIAINKDGPLAWFSFKGTGFEISARTNAVDSGLLVVKVYDKDTVTVDGDTLTVGSAKPLKTIPVISEFKNGTTTNTEVIYQVPLIRYDSGNTQADEYVVLIEGVEMKDYSNNGAHIDTYLYLDGIRIYQPMGANVSEYGDENNTVFEEVRNLVLDGVILACDYDTDDKAINAGTGTIMWTEKLNNQNYLGSVYEGNAVNSVNDYLIKGSNNEVYMIGGTDVLTNETRNGALAFFVKEESGSNVGSTKLLHLGVRAMDMGLYYGRTATGLNADLYLGTVSADGIGWMSLATLTSGTEQYINVPYELCPVVTIDGESCYQVVIRIGQADDTAPMMVSFSGIKKTNGLTLSAAQFNTPDVEQDKTDGSWKVKAGNNSFGLLRSLSLQMASNRINSLNEVESGSGFIMDSVQDEIDSMPTILPQYPSLSLDAEVSYNIYFDIANLDDVAAGDMGLIAFDSRLTDGTIDDAVDVIPGAIFVSSDGYYRVSTHGIPAKNLGDTIYFKIYAKLADGSYVYSDVFGYSAVAYAQDRLAYSDSEEMKALCVAMLNYGAAAQVYFNYKTDNLMNAILTDEQKASINGYSADMVEGLTAADSSKLGDFTKTGGFTGLSPNVAFEGAFAINFYLTTANELDGDLNFYYWRLDDYTAADVLTADNASGVVTATATSNGEYLAVVEGIAAKEIDQTVYISAVYESNGTRYCTGVIAYSLATYCQEMISYGTATMQDFAAETVVYGYYAKQYFA